MSVRKFPFKDWKAPENAYNPKKDGYIWLNMTVKEMREALEETRTVLLPIGAIEQHGYHLPFSTDVDNCRCWCEEAVKRCKAVMAPTVQYGYSGGELPGTINVDPNVLCLVIKEIIRELYRTGFRNIVVVFGHVGTEQYSSVNEALKMFLRENKYCRDLVVANIPEWWGQWGSPEEGKLNWPIEVGHSGEWETSMVMYRTPHLCREEYFLDEQKLFMHLHDHPNAYQNIWTVIDKLENGSEYPHNNQREDIEVGVMGDPTPTAIPEKGKQYSDKVVDMIVALVNELNEKHPGFSKGHSG